MWLKGQYAYELQVGPYVFQWFYDKPDPGTYRRFHVWRDWYTNTRTAYLRHALWGSKLPEYH